ncbi:hypothetical protein JL721_12292 [Aureococcus anophagefferens]|nr:hypothetical protein JL721_12292 [Aureococcus anophagefferens]
MAAVAMRTRSRQPQPAKAVVVDPVLELRKAQERRALEKRRQRAEVERRIYRVCVAPRAAAAAEADEGCSDDGDAYSVHAAEADALSCLLPSPQRPRQALVVFDRPGVKWLRRCFAWLSPIRLALCRAVARDWDECCSSDDFWRGFCELHFPPGTAALREELYDSDHVDTEGLDASYMMLYRLRSKLLPLTVPSPPPVERHNFAIWNRPSARRTTLAGYRALVELEVLRAAPAPSTVVVAGAFPLEADFGEIRLSVTLLRDHANARDGIVGSHTALAVFRDAAMCAFDVCDHAPRFVSDVRGESTLALLGARHVAEFDCCTWSSYDDPAVQRRHHGRDGAGISGPSSDDAAIVNLGELCYTFFPSAAHADSVDVDAVWHETLPNLAQLLSKLDWHHTAQSSATAVGRF